MQDDSNAILEIAKAVGDHGLISDGEQFAVARLSGGVSCDVFLVEIKRKGPVVVKRALPKLRVAADWQAPVERIANEVEWLSFVAQIDRRLVPKVLAADRNRHLFIMEYLPTKDFPVWKEQLAAGDVDMAFAGSVGAQLARIHGTTASSPSLSERFANQAQFMALRLDPYLLHAARANSDVAPALQKLADSVAASRIALMQGDISPKNILRGPETPVFLDAETSCYGDPAFDVAFCLNHLLLKSIWHPIHSSLYAQAFLSLLDAYLDGVTWEKREALARRAADLVGGLLLARIDGKSPVEYITDERGKRFVRDRAKAFLGQPGRTPAEICADWHRAVRGYFTDSGTR